MLIHLDSRMWQNIIAASIDSIDTINYEEDLTGLIAQ